jgi:hypothetical protein
VGTCNEDGSEWRISHNYSYFIGSVRIELTP